MENKLFNLLGKYVILTIEDDFTTYEIEGELRSIGVYPPIENKHYYINFIEYPNLEFDTINVNDIKDVKLKEIRL